MKVPQKENISECDWKASPHASTSICYPLSAHIDVDCISPN